MNNFLNFHILHNIAFANPNRDDTGAPKSVYYGGVERARLSSQALKRAARVSYEAEAAEPTYRTALGEDIVVEMLSELTGAPADNELKEQADRLLRMLVEAEPKKRAKADSGEDTSDESGDTLSWLSRTELQAVAKLLADGIDLSSAKKARVALQAAIDDPGLLISMFGRMFASAPTSNTEAAVQMAHAITTHAHSLEVDYFTAVDDLRQHGAGHLGLGMFTGGVYYRNFAIDRAQLHTNLDGKLDSKELDRVVQSLVNELPRGKQNSTAHHSLPSLVLATVSARPVSFAEAFEAPVQANDGYVQPSVTALQEYFAGLQTYVPELFSQTWLAAHPDLQLVDGTNRSGNLSSLLEETSTWLLGDPR